MADGSPAGPEASRRHPPDLDRFFRPRTIVVIGASATPGSQSAGLWNKIRTWGEAHQARVVPVNPRRDELDGVPCHRSALDVEGPIDLAIVLVADVLGVLDDVLAAEPAFVMVFGAGFAETGAEGEAQQRRLADAVAATETRLLGPNTNLNAFEPFRADLGGRAIALITQSGHQGRPVVQAQDLGVRFSHWAPTGNEADLEFADFARYFVDQPEVGAIACYIEGFKSGASLIDAAQHAARRGVPIVCVKVGRTDAGRSMARSHTGHLAGSDAIVDAVFTQHGIVRVDGLDELTEVAAMFARTGPPRAVARGEAPDADELGVAIYAISGGTGAHMVDLCAAAGLHVPELSEATQAELREHIPSFLRVSNPVDSGGPPSMDERGRKILDAILADDAVDVLICPITGAVDAISRPLATDLVAAAAATDKAIFVVWGSPDVADPVYRDILTTAPIPTFRTFGNCVSAARAYVDHWAFQGRLRSAASPGPTAEPGSRAAATANAILDAAGPGPLSEHDSKAVMAPYGIAAAPEVLCGTVDEAVAAFGALGGIPVVLKASSAAFGHKSDHGLVITGVRNPDEVRAAHDAILRRAAAADPDARVDGVLVCEQVTDGVEAMVGMAVDELVGPAILVGVGGTLVEVYRDVAFRVPPFDRDEARRMIRGLRGAALLDGVRGRGPVDREALVDVVMGLQQLVLDLGDRVAEIDVNPVLVRASGAVALDALVVASSGAGGAPVGG
jgi:acyl-CoA synthetase (NDP forming)